MRSTSNWNLKVLPINTLFTLKTLHNDIFQFLRYYKDNAYANIFLAGGEVNKVCNEHCENHGQY